MGYFRYFLTGKANLSPPLISSKILETNYYLKKLAYLPIHFGNRLPLILMLSLTDRCQCNCQHCGVYNRNNSNSADILSLDIIKNIVNDALNINLKYFYIFGGEPLLRDDIFEIIKFVSSLNISVQLDTNGELLSSVIADKLIKSGLKRIRVSLDSPLQHKHDQNRNRIGLFEKALSGISNALKAGLITDISTYATEENLNNGELSDLILLSKNLKVNKIRILSTICSGKLRDAQPLSDKNEKIIKKFLSYKNVYWESDDICYKNSCFVCPSLAQEYIYISSQGFLQPCCFIPIRFGNVINNNLKNLVLEMWRHPIFKDIPSWSCPMNQNKFRIKYLKY